jgi:hypothetical protein
MPRKTERKSKRHFKKDPNAPKMPNRPYIMFCNVQRPLLRAAGKDMAFSGAKEIGKLWKQLSTSEKKKYQNAFETSFALYKTKFVAYQKTTNYKTYMKEKQEWKAKFAASAQDVKDTNAPSRPGNPFIQFVLARQATTGTIKGIAACKSMQTYAIEWNGMSQSAKIHYQDVHKRQMEKYLVAKQKYQQTNEYKIHLDLLEIRKQHNKPTKSKHSCWQCSYCNKVYKKNGKQLAKHLTKCLGAVANIFYQCGECKNLFKSNGSRFQNHVANCDGKF